MLLSFHIQELLRRKSKCDLRQAADVENLVLDIEKVTNEHIGVNTMKRLLGLISDERTPRTTTLDVIARYLGYDNWEVLQELDAKSNSAFGETDHCIVTNELPIGQLLCITYQPNRQLTLKNLGEQRLLVTESANSKLHVDDIITVTHIVEGYPLLATDVEREGKHLGAFTAGKARGISFIVVRGER